ncbi:MULTISPECIES: hypothetical protein [unclassified Nitrobacter]|uniref:hypothetical protein n=1 Tax=unclassified Nitrobacter TaxID=2620411 RepID=UPI0009278CFD|nr:MULTISPECIES: hypothetical protein [unclassified Nitrobacter]MBN9147187.1 hypothetical protein [Nitrobacter sp.]OJV02315.1 MAG: hypothetical protein BGO16_01830 [Nitrobacter sp. 62-23]
MSSGMRGLTIDELDSVSGGAVHTEVRKTTLIGIEGKGILAIGTVSIDGGPALPSAEWIPLK